MLSNFDKSLFYAQAMLKRALDSDNRYDPTSGASLEMIVQYLQRLPQTDKQKAKIRLVLGLNWLAEGAEKID